MTAARTNFHVSTDRVHQNEIAAFVAPDERVALRGRELSRSRRRSSFADGMTLLALQQSGIISAIKGPLEAIATLDSRPPFSPTEQARKIADAFDPSSVLSHRCLGWSGSTTSLKAAYSSLALAHAESAFALTLQLGSDRTERGLRSSRGLLRHVAREIRWRLQRTLGRDIKFWFTAALPANGQAVLRGVIGIDGREAKCVRSTLARVARNPDRSRPVSLTEIATGHPRSATSSEQPLQANVIPDNGAFTCTRELRAAAKSLYELHRLVHRELVQRRADVQGAPGFSNDNGRLTSSGS